MGENKSYIIETQYFPVVDWFKLSTKHSYGEIEQYETYQKMSFRNRCIISGSNGLIDLTVPLEKGREQKRLIRDIKIAQTQPWQKHHWRAILSSYSKAPFFEYFGNTVEHLIMDKQVFLFDLNLMIIEWLQKVLKVQTNIALTNEYIKSYDPASYLDVRNCFLPKNFKQPENWQPRYTQVFEDKFGFIPNLSILDLLFCKGGL